MDAPTYPRHLWQWRVLDPDRPWQRRYKTRHHMTESEALAMDPTAERVEGTLRVIEGPGQAHSYTGAKLY